MKQETKTEKNPIDIYSFIRSKAVADHCCSIGKTWNTLEMAVIIDRCRTRTIDDKHAAWQELIDYYPDMPSMPNYHDVQFDSVHKVIAERIEYERQAIKWFKTPENGVTYTYGPHSWGTPQFTTFEKALENLNEKWLRDKKLDPYFVKQIATHLTAGRSKSGVPYIQFEKKTPDDIDRWCSLSANVDGDGNMYAIWASADGEIEAKWLPKVSRSKLKSGLDGINLFDFASVFFIDLPTPFKVGDLLTYPTGGIQTIFILDWFMPDDDRHERSLKGVCADGSDMGGNGLLVNDAGHLYWDHVGDYDSYEYYADELKGKDILLYYVSLYQAGKIRLVELLNRQCRNIMEVPLSNNFGLSDHDCSISPGLLYENREALLSEAPQ